MTDETKRRAADAFHEVLRIVTPILLLAVIYFVKPIFDAVPRLERQAEVSAIQQQAALNAMVEVSAKQESSRAEITNVKTKVEVLSEKVSRLERKLDD